MATYSSHFSGQTEINRFNYTSAADGASMDATVTLALYNPNSVNVVVNYYVTLNSGDTTGFNNTQGWRGDGKNADLLLDSRPLIFPPGDYAQDMGCFFDGIAYGNGVFSIWATCQGYSNIQHLYDRTRGRLVYA